MFTITIIGAFGVSLVSDVIANPGGWLRLPSSCINQKNIIQLNQLAPLISSLRRLCGPTTCLG